MPNERTASNGLRKDLFHAAQIGDLEKLLSKLISLDRETLVQPGSLDTILHVASRQGHLNVVRVIIENFELGYLLTSENRDGKCALHEAAQNLQCDVAQYLIDQGTPVDALKRADWTPLMLACTRNHSSDMTKLLLENGAQTCVRNKDGWTAFHIASRQGNCDVLEILLNHDPDCWNSRSNNGRTPLHTAALHGHFDVLKLLLKYSSSTFINSKDSCGTTPLMDAARSGSSQCCFVLLNAGVVAHCKDNLGKNAFYAAVQAGAGSDVVNLLRNRGLDENCPIGQTTTIHLEARP